MFSKTFVPWTRRMESSSRDQDMPQHNRVRLEAILRMPRTERNRGPARTQTKENQKTHVFVASIMPGLAIGTPSALQRILNASTSRRTKPGTTLAFTHTCMHHLKITRYQLRIIAAGDGLVSSNFFGTTLTDRGCHLEELETGTSESCNM